MMYQQQRWDGVDVRFNDCQESVRAALSLEKRLKR